MSCDTHNRASMPQSFRNNSNILHCFTHDYYCIIQKKKKMLQDKNIETKFYD